MENTREEALKFFGTHLNASAGCKGGVFHTNRHSEGKDGKLIMSASILADIHERTYSYSDFYLKLTSLSDITDEDAIEVAKMALGYSKLPQQINISETVNRKIGFGFSFWLNGESEYQIDLGNFYNPKLFCLNRHTSPSEYLHNALKISDYLRSRGYALPWMGVSVEEQIKRGWIKLKTK